MIAITQWIEVASMVQETHEPIISRFLFGTISLKRTMLRYYLATPNPSFIPSILCSIPLLSISYGMKSETHRVKQNALENFYSFESPY